MKAIFIAAGKGSRLGTLTNDLPKPLVDVNGKSIIERQINLLYKKNINDIVIVTGYKKEKFTFLSPARMGLQKGTEKIWEALNLCKSDFEMIQIKWYDNRNPEEEAIAQKWINNPPKQVKFVPIMPREELGRYMTFADAILGQVSGIQADVDRSGALCKKAVVHYANPKRMYIVNDKIIPSPFT